MTSSSAVDNSIIEMMEENKGNAAALVKKALAKEEIIAKYKKRFTTLMERRRTIEGKWQQVRDLLDPAATKYLGSEDDETIDKNIDDSKILDSTPSKMAQTAADGLFGGLSNPAAQWFSFYTGTYESFDSMLSKESKEWLKLAEECVRDSLSGSNFYAVLHSVYKEMLEFGISLMMAYSDPETVVKFFSYTVGSFWCAQNSRREIDTVYIKSMVSAADLVDTYGPERCPEAVIKALEDRGEADQLFELVQCIQPWNMFGDASNSEDFLYEDVRFVTEAQNEDPILYRGGYKTKPFIVARWAESWDQVYPRTAPGIMALPDIRLLYEATKAYNMAAEWASEPAFFYDSMLERDIKGIKPGDMVPVTGLAGNKQAIVPAIPPVFNFEANHIYRQGLINNISALFYNREIMMVSARAQQNHTMTATEVMELKQEKNAVMGPIIVRSAKDVLVPSLDRVFEIAQNDWQILPDPPTEIDGLEIKPYFTSDLAISQRQAWYARAQDVVLWLQSVAQIAGPAATMPINWDRWVREFERTDMLPPMLLNTEQEVEQMQQQQAQAMQQQQQMDAMERGSGVAKNLTDAQPTEANVLGQLMQQGGGM